jgi:hypothetical protein
MTMIQQQIEAGLRLFREKRDASNDIVLRAHLTRAIEQIEAELNRKVLPREHLERYIFPYLPKALLGLLWRAFAPLGSFRHCRLP